jgi:hypothetical protein
LGLPPTRNELCIDTNFWLSDIPISLALDEDDDEKPREQ